MTIEYRDFSDIGGLDTEGSATSDGGALVLTRDGNIFETGESFSLQAVDISRFSSHFQFDASSEGSPADGLAFVVRAALGPVGDDGSSLGFKDIDHAVGVGFEEYGTPYVFESTSDGSIGTFALTPNTADGEIWDVWVDYDGTTLSVRFANDGVRPSDAQLSMAIDIPSAVGGTMGYVGFTGATGSATETAQILNWRFDSADTVVFGSADADTLTGSAAGDVIYASGGNDRIDGGAGDDHLDGGTGADRMYGGTGDDTYVIDDYGDRAVETHNGTIDDGGKDTVQTRLSFHLGDFVENLTLLGTANVNATGNSLDNVLTGNAGGNVLNGGAGADIMAGGDGNDAYLVDNSGDVVIENVDQGIDKVVSGISYTLTANVENLTLTGAGAINATGNEMGNIIFGNAGNNRIDGGAGNDHLFGGAGSDTFVFSANSGFDVIKDFSVSQNDHIDLSAYTHGVADSGIVHQSDVHTIIDLGNGNTVVVANAVAADVLAHIIW